jgi:hypothetical protein
VGYDVKSVVPDKVKHFDCRIATNPTNILKEAKPVTHFFHAAKNINFQGKSFLVLFPA